jgi:hypothetical protein
MMCNIQDYFVHCAEFKKLGNGVSERGSVSVLRWQKEYTYSVGFLSKI